MRRLAARISRRSSRDGPNFAETSSSRAETLAQKALALDPATTSAYRLLADNQHVQGTLSILPLGQIDRALEINPSDAESLWTRGIILVWAGRAAEALPWLEGALRFDRANARAARFYGMAYYFLGRYGEAVEAMDRALAGNLGRNTQLHGAHPFLAATYAEIGRRQDAEARARLSCVSRRSSAPSGSPDNSARRKPATICSTG